MMAAVDRPLEHQPGLVLTSEQSASQKTSIFYLFSLNSSTKASRAAELVSGTQHYACILAYFLKSMSSSVQTPQLSERQRKYAASLLARLQRVRIESRERASHIGEGGAFQLNTKYHDETRVDRIDERDGQICEFQEYPGNVSHVRITKRRSRNQAQSMN
jgi:hypothetical protein